MFQILTVSLFKSIQFKLKKVWKYGKIVKCTIKWYVTNTKKRVIVKRECPKQCIWLGTACDSKGF